MNDIELLKRLDDANALVCSQCEECSGISDHAECNGCIWVRTISCAGKEETFITQTTCDTFVAIQVIGGNYMRIGGSWICFKPYDKDLIKLGECDFMSVCDFFNGLGDELECECEEWEKQPILHWNGKGWVV